MCSQQARQHPAADHGCSYIGALSQRERRRLRCFSLCCSLDDVKQASKCNSVEARQRNARRRLAVAVAASPLAREMQSVHCALSDSESVDSGVQTSLDGRCNDVQAGGHAGCVGLSTSGDISTAANTACSAPPFTLKGHTTSHPPQHVDDLLSRCHSCLVRGRAALRRALLTFSHLTCPVVPTSRHLS